MTPLEGSALSRYAHHHPDAPDLRAQLRDTDDDRLAALLGAVPCLADAVEGHGPLSTSWPFGIRAGRPLDRDGLAHLLASPAGTEFLVLSLDAAALALAQLAVWHGGALTRDDVRGEIPALDTGELDALAHRLHDRLLTDRDAGWVVLRPGVAAAVDLPGLPVAPALRHVNSDVLAAKLGLLGRPAPSRKSERIDAVVGALRDPDTIEQVVDELPSDAARALALLVEHGPQRVQDLGEPHWPPYGYRRGHDSAIGTLLDRSLIGVDTEEQTCVVWLDVLVGLNGGRLFGEAFPTPPADPVLTALSGGQPALPPVLEHLDALLAHWRARPADALTGGGLGVRPVRAAAKSLGVPAPYLGLLAVLAAEIGLLGVVERGSTGRGRNRRTHRQWAPTELAERWTDEPPSWRWALLVDTWRHSPQVVELEGLPERHEPHAVVTDATAVATRSAWLLHLAALPEGRGLAVDDVAEVAAASNPALLGAPGHVDAMLAASRALGLVPHDGPVGLTAAGRAVLDGPAAVEALLPAPDDHVVVQADLTIVAPPGAPPDVTATLARWADLESAAGARVYRLSEQRLAAALAIETDDEVLGWLKEHSRVDVPQNVEYLIRDMARRRGRVRAGSATTYLRSDDPALLTQAIGVRAAKLRLLAPTVAISPQSRTKVLAALADAGVAAVAEDATGAAVQADTPQAERVGWHRPGAGLPTLRRVPPPDEIAARLNGDGRQQTLTTPGDDRRRARRDHAVYDPIERLRRRQLGLDDNAGPSW